jgi:hypothetical protein
VVEIKGFDELNGGSLVGFTIKGVRNPNTSFTQTFRIKTENKDGKVIDSKDDVSGIIFSGEAPEPGLINLISVTPIPNNETSNARIEFRFSISAPMNAGAVLEFGIPAGINFSANPEWSITGGINQLRSITISAGKVSITTDTDWNGGETFFNIQTVKINWNG